MITEINKAWNWKGFNATEIISTNDFGNVIFKTDKNQYWRLCPEEISCDRIAETESDFIKVSSNAEFIEDWEMADLVRMAKTKLGELEEHQKYCLKIPAVIGGKYEIANLGKINFAELILFSGDLGFKIKDLKDGQEIKLNIKNQA